MVSLNGDRIAAKGVRCDAQRVVESEVIDRSIPVIRRGLP
jgi:hypothetical protein